LLRYLRRQLEIVRKIDMEMEIEIEGETEIAKCREIKI
jgi:hypothetical protein